MAIKSYWLITGKVMWYEYIDGVTPSEFLHATNEFRQTLDHASHPINVVADWRNATSYPINYDMIGTLSMMFRHANMGWIYVIGMNPVLKFWAELFTRVAGLRWKSVQSTEEALQAIQQNVQPQKTNKPYTNVSEAASRR